MARVFANEALEKCQELGVDGRYEMILLATQRAKETRKGKTPIFPTQRGHSHVVNALRDFETGEVDLDELWDNLIQSYQKVNKSVLTSEDEE